MLRNPWTLGEGGQNEFLWNAGRSPVGLPMPRDRCFGEGGRFPNGVLRWRFCPGWRT
jgi:hypothetical protein